MDGGVVIVTTEDSHAFMVSKLRAAGADLDRVCLMGLVQDSDHSLTPLRLKHDLPMIDRAARDFQAKLIVIDPLSAHIDSFHEKGMREVIGRLEVLATRLGAALVCTPHPSKLGRTALSAGLGSIGAIGRVRTGLVIGVHPDDPDVRVLAVTKNNLAAVPESLTFSLRSSESCATVNWLGTTMLSADDLYASPEKGDGKKLAAARTFLRNTLVNGPMRAKDVATLARMAGISPKTLERAQGEMVVPKRIGFGPSGYSEWSLAVVE